MRGCQLVRDGDRLTIRPTRGTVLVPVLACVFLGGAWIVAGVRAAQLPPADLNALAREPITWGYAALSFGLLVGAGGWYWAVSGPIVLDRQTKRLEIDRRSESLVGAAGVALTVSSSSDSADSHHIEIVFADRRVRVGRVGWTDETDRARAEANAARIADFLGVPAPHAAH